MNTLGKIARENLRTDLPEINAGDTVTVQVKIVEGTVTRLQAFKGTVIAIKNGGIAKTVTVRRVTAGQGVERIFPLISPNVDSIKIERRGDVRRAKLYYLRDKVGKAARIKEKSSY